MEVTMPFRMMFVVAFWSLWNVNAFCQEKDISSALDIDLTSFKPKVTIKGNIKKLFKSENLADSFAFQYLDLVTAKRVIAPIVKDSLGNFSISFPVNSKQEIFLSQATQRGPRTVFSGSTEFSFFVKPNEVIDLDYYTSSDRKIWNIQFDGPTAKSKSQFQKYKRTLGENEIDPYARNIPDSLKGNTDALKKYIADRLQSNLQFNTKYFDTVKTNSEVKTQADIDMQFAAALDMINAIDYDLSRLDILNAFLLENSITINNPQAYGFDKYTRFLDQYYMMIVAEANKQVKDVTISRAQMAQFLLKKDGLELDVNKELLTKMAYKYDQTTAEEQSYFSKKFMGTKITEYLAALPDNNPIFEIAIQLKDPFIRDIFSTRSLYDLISGNKLDYVHINLERYKKSVSKGFIKDRFLKFYKEECDLMNNSRLTEEHGIISPSRFLSDDPIKTISEKHRGKVIYIDVWATWCIPCLKEMENSKRLRAKFDGKNIIFIYLCVKSPTEQLWKKQIAAKDIKGENYFLDQTQSKRIAWLYNITSIPRYLLIDKNGIIVEEKMSRPGDPATAKMINELFK